MANITTAVGKRVRDARGHWLGKQRERARAQRENGFLDCHLALLNAARIPRTRGCLALLEVPESTIPIGPTTLPTRTDIVRVGGGCAALPQGEDYACLVGVTSAPRAALLPTMGARPLRDAAALV
ncbi:hypothetical protein [Streptomyces sp. NPDC052036]|uniref:hypothetical protein n=1 Tax=unclassified Streptomyces TaxID=2593676 RepID=UPI003426A2EF